MSAEQALAGTSASGEGRRSMTAPLRRRDFRLLVAGQSVSILGDMVFLVALPFLILNAGYGTRGLGATLTGFGLARIATALPGGALADRFGARPVMLGADVTRCAALSLLAAVTVTGTPSSALLVGTGVLLGLCEGVYLPAYRSITPALVPDEELEDANSLCSVGNLLANVIGPPIGGVVVAVFAPGPAIVVDAASFAVSVATLAVMGSGSRQGSAESAGSAVGTEPAAASTTQRPAPSGSPGSGSLARFVRESSLFRTVLLMTAVLGVSVAGTFEVALPVLARARHDLGASGFGFLMAALGVGMLAGGASAGRLTRRVPKGPVVVGLLAASGGLLAAVPHVGGPIPTAAAMAVVGALDGVMAVLVMTATQRMPPPHLLARAQSLLSLVTFATYPVSVVIAGVVLNHWSPSAMFALTGAGFVVVALVGSADRGLRGL